MDPIGVLMEEHRLIESFLDAARGCAARLSDPTVPCPPRADLVRIATFIRGFADRHHHGKEEEILFAAMLECGFSDSIGPLAVMLADHAEGRRLTGVIAEVGQGEGALSGEEREAATAALEGYARLLAEHIWKEDQVLYPMAERVLPGQVWDQVVARCTAYEETREAEGDVARLRDLGEVLIKAYGAVKA